MAARLQGFFYSEKGTIYYIQLNDADYTGDTIDFNCVEGALSWEPEGDEDNRFAAVMVSQFAFRMIVNSAELQAVVDDLVDATEGRFTVTFGNINAIPFSIAWNGYVLSDLVRIEDVPLEVGYQLEIKAKDGLNRLRNIDYNNAGSPYTGKETFIQHIFNSLNKLTNITALYTTQTLLNVICNWHETSYTYSASINPLGRSRVDHKAFYYVDTNGNNVFSSCFTVLKDICTAWGMRIVASGTGFWIFQINELAGADNLTVFRYTKAQAETVASSQDISIAHDQLDAASPIFRYSGGFFDFFAPIRRVQVDYRHIATRNFPEISGQVWTESSQPSITIANIDSNAGVAIFRITGTLQVDANQITTFTLPYHLVFLFTVKVGSNYLRRDITFSGSAYDIGPTFWDSSGVHYYTYLLPRPIRRDPESVTYDIEIVTPGIPVDDDLLFTFQYSKARSVADGSELNAFDYDIDYNFGSVYFEYIFDGTFSSRNDINRYASTNDAEASKILELSTTVGDGPNTVSPGHIEVLEDDNVTWVASDGWLVGGTGTTKQHSQLLCNEIIRGQLSPAKRIDTEFQMRDPFDQPLLPHTPIYYDSSFWVMQRGRLNMRKDSVTGVWYRLQTATGYSEQSIVFMPKDAEDGPPSTGGNTSGSDSGGGVSGNTLTMFSEIFTAAGSPTFTVTKNDGVLADSTDRIIVFRNGQQIASTHIDTVDAPNGTLTLTFTPASGEEITIVWWIIE